MREGLIPLDPEERRGRRAGGGRGASLPVERRPVLGRDDQSTDTVVDVITEEQLLSGMESLTPTEPSANGGSGGRLGPRRPLRPTCVGVASARLLALPVVSWERRRGALTSARADLGEAWHDAPIRAGRAGPEVRPERQRGAAQPRLRLRHAGARAPEARLRRSLLSPIPSKSRRS